MTAEAGKRPVTLVTGGRRGIGLAIAEAFAAAGHDVALTDIVRDDAADAAIARIEALGARAHFVAFDLADLSAHETALAEIEAALGPVDILVNNAGIGAVVRGDLLELLPENFDTVLAVNLRGTLFFTQAAVKRMLARRGLHPRAILTVSSVSAALASPERTDYCVSKAGLAMFVQNLALRLADTDIGVFELRPGIIRTDMTVKVSEKYDRLIADGLVPAGRWGEGADIGRAAVALASGAFGFATGTVVNLDGGLAIPRL
ncbi:NAD(P)-dependent dehydrogenase, short-chain alcohol dehydrogenase family [Kaistia soli DSM 19436]|uniref:NAD(P)-dependent dehydrogenase, short-chain alcohol dehydrogenase family n=1 Tax=Kaistia soli DSM 19436 TaxID=1122133 RepID=A0A1M5LKD7_9HYPH|nr:3-ketoacyl-ACP reductase [Kaistia soli]SHG65497.1 NAD(P)-dependent dehydrogenase, short-chain alcohol dehydrogenase family [Kaistia soli DSM 19436]